MFGVSQAKWTGLGIFIHHLIDGNRYQCLTLGDHKGYPGARPYFHALLNDVVTILCRNRSGPVDKVTVGVCEF